MFLENTSEGTRVSERAFTLYELGEDSPEGAKAAREMAKRPQAFQVIQGQYGDKLPADNSIRVYLMNKGYQRDAADQLIKHYRETVRWLETKLPKEAATRPAGVPIERTPEARQTVGAATSARVEAEPQLQSNQTRLQFKVSLDTDAVIVFHRAGNATGD